MQIIMKEVIRKMCKKTKRNKQNSLKTKNQKHSTKNKTRKRK